MRAALLAVLALACIEATVVNLGLARADQSANAPVGLADPAGLLQATQARSNAVAVANAQKSFLATPAQALERRQSETAFQDQTSSEAVETLSDQFGTVLDSLDWIVSDIARNDDFEHFLSDTSARVTIDGHHRLIESMLPIRTPDEDGTKRAVDLTVQQDGGALAPTNPLVDVSLPQDLSDGIALGEGANKVRIEPTDASGANSAVLVDGVAGLWANTSTDTDFIAAPVPTGLETFTQLRSPDAPETMRLRLSAAGGVELMKTTAGDVSVWVAGVPVGSIPPATATDAQGRSFPVNLNVDGDTLVLTLKHRSLDVAYPVLVDPVFENWYVNQNWFYGSQAGLDQWTYADYTSGVSSPFTSGKQCVNPNLGCWGSYGLYIYSPWGDYPSNAWAQWYYRPYGWNAFGANGGRSTYIASAGFGLQYNKSTSLNNATNANGFGIVDGIYSRKIGVGWTGIATPLGDVSAANVSVTAGQNAPGADITTGQIAVFAIMNATSSTTHAGFGAYYTGGAVVTLDDADMPSQPVVSHSNLNLPAGWTNNVSDTVSFSSADNVCFSSQGNGPIAGCYTNGGLGIAMLAIEEKNPVTGNTVWAWPQRQPSELDASKICTGLNAAPCAVGRNTNYTYSASTMTDGVHEMHACAYDANWRAACSAGWTVKTDITKPTIVVDGGVWSSQGSTLDGDFWSLNVRATDATSGVANIDVTVDGQVPPEGDCEPNSCEMLLNVTEMTAGSHHVVIQVTDAAGNIASKDWWINTSQTASFTDDVTLRSLQGDSSLQYQAYDAGESFEGMSSMPLVAEGAPADPIATPRAGGAVRASQLNAWSNRSYGSCSTPADLDGDMDTCAAPLEINSFPMCQQHASLYKDSNGGPYPFTAVPLRGAQAAIFDDGQIVEIYTGNTTIEIAGDDPAQVARLAWTVVPAAQAAIGGVVAGSPLPPPSDPSILSSTTPC